MISPNTTQKSTTKWFLFEPTDDLSLTMRFIDPQTGAESECMHSLRGAFSETDYIYGFAIRKTLELGFSQNFLSIGLGLGYCETLLAGLMLQSTERVEIESFESDERLREQFTNWILEKPVIEDFLKLYNQTALSTSHLVESSKAAICSQLREWVHAGQFKLRERLTFDTGFSHPFSCVLFDAFSSKSTPEVWTEQFLMNFFEVACAPNCIFATYACTGVLKRSLKRAGFEVQIRPGFSSKRDSTFAVRILNKNL